MEDVDDDDRLIAGGVFILQPESVHGQRVILQGGLFKTLG